MLTQLAELRNMVESEIKACLDGKFPSPLSKKPVPRVESYVTLTKVPGPLSKLKQSNEVENKVFRTATCLGPRPDNIR